MRNLDWVREAELTQPLSVITRRDDISPKGENKGAGENKEEGIGNVVGGNSPSVAERDISPSGGE
jgi:hypothetical protein